MAEIPTPVRDGRRGAYSQKTGQYFAGARASYVAELPDNPEATILEVGSGAMTLGTLEHLSVRQIDLKAHCSSSRGLPEN